MFFLETFQSFWKRFVYEVQSIVPLTNNVSSLKVPHSYLIRSICFKSSHRGCSVNKVCSWKFRKAYNFIKTRLQHRCFAEKIPKFLKTRILKNIWRLLLLFLEDGHVDG